MTLYAIPTSTSNVHYTQSVQLSGVIYQLEMRYNTRMQRWVLNVADVIGRNIICGIVMLTGRNLVGQYKTLSLPPGTLFCHRDGQTPLEPTLGSFLVDTRFLYADPLT